MNISFSNLRDVKLVDHNGPTYECTLDLNIMTVDPVSGEEVVHPDSGVVQFISNPNDTFGLGPNVYQAIQNGEYEGTVTDLTQG